MDELNRDAVSERQTLADALLAAVAALPGFRFAVLDGALFDDLPAVLNAARISSRSLFLDHADKDIEAAGPWLVELADEDAQTFVTQLAVTQPCAVFWSCPDGEVALWRHLRSINEVLYQRAAINGAESASAAFQRMMFRHWDPNVLAQVLPALDQAQFARFFGPGLEIAFVPSMEWGGGIKRARNVEGVEPSAGLLRISGDIAETVVASRFRRSAFRISAYLRRNAPDQTASISDEALAARTQEWMREGRGFDIRNEAGLGRWCYLQLLTGGQMGKMPEVREVMSGRHGGESGDDRVEVLMRLTASQVRSGAAVP